MWRTPGQLLARFDSGMLLAVLLFVTIFSLAAVPPTDPDLWWHLANGRLLAALGAFPHTDLYSFSAVGHQWVMHEWLSDLVMYGLYSLGGLSLLVALFAGVVTAGALLLFTLLRRSGLHPTAAVGVTLAGALAGSTAWGSRPQVFNVLFTGVLLLGLQLYRAGRLRAWWLSPFLWLWANLHSAFLIGVIITGLFLCGEVIDARRSSAVLLSPRLRALTVALIAGVGLSLINPYGLDTLLFPLGTLTSPLIQNNIQEWASPDFHTLPGQLLEGLLFLILLGLATGRVRATTSEWLWALALLYLALSSQRQVSLFVLAAAPLIGRCGQAVIAWLGDLHAPTLALPRGGRELEPPGGRATAGRETAAAVRWSPVMFGGGRPGPVLGLINLVLLVVVGAGMVGYRALPNLTPDKQSAAIAAAFPVKAVDILQQQGPGLRVLNYYDYGGYLVWKTYPAGGRVFIDGRVEVYGPRVFADYLTVNYLSRNWPDVLARYQPNAVIMPRGHPVVDLLRRDPGWSELTGDALAAVFKRSVSGAPNPP